VYDESYELDESELKTTIEKAIVSDAVNVYNLLKKKGIGKFINIKLLFLYLYFYFILKYFDFNFNGH